MSVRFKYLIAPETRSQVWRIVWSRKSLFLALAATGVLPLALLDAIGSTRAVSDQDPGFNPKVGALVLGAMAAALVQAALDTVLKLVGRGAIIRATADLYVERDPRFLDCLGRGTSQACSLLLASMIITSLIMVPAQIMGVLTRLKIGDLEFHTVLLILGICIVPPILCARLILVCPLVVLEQLNVFKATRRAWNLSRHFVHDFFGAFFGFWLMQVLVKIVLGLCLATWEDQPPLQRALYMGVRRLPELLFFSLYSILGTALYFNCRIYKEELTKEEFSLEPTNDTRAIFTLVKGADDEDDDEEITLPETP